jgi:hypothetical protein
MANENVGLVYWEDGRGAMGNGYELYQKMTVNIFLIKLTFEYGVGFVALVFFSSSNSRPNVNYLSGG